MWRRDLGEEEALALMRAQNEPPETVVRLVRGDPPGEPTDVPGAYRVGRVDESAVAEGQIWPQSRASQVAGLCVGSQDGEYRGRVRSWRPPPWLLAPVRSPTRCSGQAEPRKRVLTARRCCLGTADPRAEVRRRPRATEKGCRKPRR